MSIIKNRNRNIIYSCSFKSPNRYTQLAQRWADLYSKSLAKYPGLTVSEAVPPALERAEGWFRYQVQIRAESSKLIAAAWRWIAGARPAPKELRIALDIDAVNVM